MVKEHSDSERGNPLPPHGLLFSINSKGSFICTIPDRIAHTTAFVTPVVEHCLERDIAQWVHSMKDQSNDPSHHERTLLPRSYISLPMLRRVDIKTVGLTFELLICGDGIKQWRNYGGARGGMHPHSHHGLPDSPPPLFDF